MAIDERFHAKRKEIYERLVASPTAEELKHLQLHLDALEKWHRLGEVHSHDDHQGTDTNPQHDHHDQTP